MYLTLIVLNLTFHCTLSYDLDHHSTTLYYPIFNVFEGTYEDMDIDGHSSGGIIVHFNE